MLGPVELIPNALTAPAPFPPGSNLVEVAVKSDRLFLVPAADGKQLNGSFQIRNLGAPGSAVLFKIKTNAVNKLKVNPVMSFVEPMDQVTVNVQSRDQDSSGLFCGNEKLLIRIFSLEGINWHRSPYTSAFNPNGKELGKLWSEISTQKSVQQQHVLDIIAAHFSTVKDPSTLSSTPRVTTVKTNAPALVSHDGDGDVTKAIMSVNRPSNFEVQQKENQAKLLDTIEELKVKNDSLTLRNIALLEANLEWKDKLIQDLKRQIMNQQKEASNSSIGSDIDCWGFQFCKLSTPQVQHPLQECESVEVIKKNEKCENKIVEDTSTKPETAAIKKIGLKVASNPDERSKAPESSSKPDIEEPLSFTERQERLKRRANLILFNLNESPDGTSATLRRQSDYRMAREICAEVMGPNSSLYKSNMHILYTWRIGFCKTSSSGEPRPLRVKFENEETASKIWQEAEKAHRCGFDKNSVCFGKDLTKMQVQQKVEARQKMFKKNSN